MTNNRNLLTLTAEEKHELARLGSIPDAAGGRRVPSTAYLGNGRGQELSRDRAQYADQCGHHRALENAFRTAPARRTGRSSSGKPTADRDRHRPSASGATGTTETQRWKYPLVVPETGPRVRGEQVHRATHSDPSPLETAPSRTVFGE